MWKRPSRTLITLELRCPVPALTLISLQATNDGIRCRIKLLADRKWKHGEKIKTNHIRWEWRGVKGMVGRMEGAERSMVKPATFVLACMAQNLHPYRDG